MNKRKTRAAIKAACKFVDMFYIEQSHLGKKRLRRFKSIFTPEEYVTAADTLVDLLEAIKAWDEKD